MKYEIIDEKVNEKASSNEKNRKENNQEEHIEIDDFDNFILQSPSIEDLLKAMIEKIDMVNVKIDFTTQHFIPDSTQLPQDLFLNEDFDIE